MENTKISATEKTRLTKDYVTVFLNGHDCSGALCAVTGAIRASYNNFLTTEQDEMIWSIFNRIVGIIGSNVFQQSRIETAAGFLIFMNGSVLVNNNDKLEQLKRILRYIRVRTKSPAAVGSSKSKKSFFGFDYGDDDYDSGGVPYLTVFNDIQSRNDCSKSADFPEGFMDKIDELIDKHHDYLKAYLASVKNDYQEKFSKADKETFFWTESKLQVGGLLSIFCRQFADKDRATSGAAVVAIVMVFYQEMIISSLKKDTMIVYVDSVDV